MAISHAKPSHVVDVRLLVIKCNRVHCPVSAIVPLKDFATPFGGMP